MALIDTEIKKFVKSEIDDRAMKRLEKTGAVYFFISP